MCSKRAFGAQGQPQLWQSGKWLGLWVGDRQQRAQADLLLEVLHIGLAALARLACGLAILRQPPLHLVVHVTCMHITRIPSCSARSGSRTARVPEKLRLRSTQATAAFISHKLQALEPLSTLVRGLPF